MWIDGGRSQPSVYQWEAPMLEAPDKAVAQSRCHNSDNKKDTLEKFMVVGKVAYFHTRSSLLGFAGLSGKALASQTKWRRTQNKRQQGKKKKEKTAQGK